MLLTNRPRDEDLARAIGAVRRAALEQEPPRAFLLRLRIYDLARLKSLAAAERNGGRLAIGSAIRRRDAALLRGDYTRVRQSDHRSREIFGALVRLLAELLNALLRVLHARLQLRRALLHPPAECIDKARLGCRLSRGIRTPQQA